jgi:hypothetical protein
MFYVKNVPGWERVLRVLAGAGALAGGVVLLGGWPGWAVGASGAGLVLSGLFGWCPACAMVGRRLDAGR